MSLGTLFLLIASVALLLTLLSLLLLRSKSHWAMLFLQYFSGTLFVVSGYVKAVDPLGTAYKMEQYFAEFEATFSSTWLSFLSPLFPALSQQSTAFALIMVILEIIVGVLLLLGIWKRTATMAFFAIMVFFTLLTGFTYLTGYVPTGVNFFSFSEWGPFVKTNMRVTDCGCFGDFIKLEPRTSFLKDVFLMIPAIIMLVAYRKLHTFFPSRTGNWTAIALSVLTILFSARNVWWDEPVTDFRPFREGVDLRGQKLAEEEAQANVPITMVMKNKEDGRIVKISQEQYMKDFKSYPKEEWEFLDPEKGEPAIPVTKISDFEVSDQEGADMTQDILQHEGYQFLIISYSLKDDGMTETLKAQTDTIWATDTIDVEGVPTAVQRVEQVNESKVVVRDFQWDEDFIAVFTQKINPLLLAAEAEGFTCRMITKFADTDRMEDFRQDSGFKWPILQADDILLKTIIRSNPGVVLMRDGKIIRKWHYRQLPDYATIRKRDMP